MVLAAAGCAEAPRDPRARSEFERIDDPAEPVNHAILAANQALDRNVLKSVAEGCKNYVPERARRSIHNFVSNRREPVIGFNDLL